MDDVAELTELTIPVFSQIGSTLLEIAHGIDVLPENDPHLHEAEAAIATLASAAVPGKYLVDILPFREYPLSILVSAETHDDTSSTRSFVVSWSRVQEKCRSLETAGIRSNRHALECHGRFYGKLPAICTPVVSTHPGQAEGTAKASYSSYALQNIDPSRDKGYQETVIKSNAGVIYLGK